MTTPLAKARGFSEHARGNPHVTLRWPRPGRKQDVLRRLNVPVLDIPAVGADVSPDGERLLNDLATLEAPLRGKVRWYFDDPATGTFSLEAEDILESRPTRIRDGAGEMAVVEHILDPQVFDGDEGVKINVLAGRLVGVVLALAGDFEVLPGRLPRRLLSAVRALLPAARLALCPTELLGGPLEAARVFDRIALGVRKEYLEPNIESDGRAVPFLRRWRSLADDEHISVSIGPENQVSGLRGSFKRTMLLDLDAASEFLGNPELAGSFARVEVHVPTRSVLAKLYRVPAVRTLEAREAGLLPKLLVVEEPLEGFVQAVRKGLHRGLRDVFRARATAASFEPVREIVSGQKLASLLVMGLDHLKHLVVKVAAFRPARKEHPALNTSWIQAVLKRFIHSLILLDIGTSHYGFYPGA